MTMSRQRPRSFRHDQSGAVAATYALALIPLVAIAGMGFDYARLAGMDSELQNAADQAALAAASQLTGDAGACARASAAAVGLVSNLTLLASGDNAVTVPDEPGCDAEGSIRFWQDKEKTEAADADDNANFVEVLVNARSVDYALLPVTGLLTSDSIQGIAFAGLGSAICKLPPVFMCNPNEDSDPDFDVEDYVGKGIRLLANDGGGTYGPGNFGYLQTNAGNGAQATAETLGREEVPGDCVSTDSVVTKPGAQVSVLDALNTRFGIYNSVNQACGNDGSLCPPSANARQDLLNKNPNNNSAITNAGFQVGNNPYRPTSPTADYADPSTLDPMGYPRDKCHAVSVTGSCTDGQVGDGNWDRNAYFVSNDHIWSSVPSASLFSSYGVEPADATLRPTRYQVYLYEYFNNKMATAQIGNLKAQGTPLFNGPGIAPGGASADRRVLSVAVVNCESQASKIAGSTPVEPEDWVDVFLVEPSLRRGSGQNVRTEQFDVYIEVIGNSTLGGGATAGQEIRKDVPYLIE
jgi:Flp pilus assembly protein TadG